jgi:hypothetical protein
MLHKSTYPDSREWAANSLANGGKASKEVVEALLSRATDDPAPEVRAACLCGLVKLRIAGPAVVRVVARLQKDQDPLVRHAVQTAGEWLQAHPGRP